jgi:hypothetical protein
MNEYYFIFIYLKIKLFLASYFVLAMALPFIQIIAVFMVNVYILLFSFLNDNFDLC